MPVVDLEVTSCTTQHMNPSCNGSPQRRCKPSKRWGFHSMSMAMGMAGQPTGRSLTMQSPNFRLSCSTKLGSPLFATPRVSSAVSDATERSSDGQATVLNSFTELFWRLPLRQRHSQRGAHPGEHTPRSGLTVASDYPLHATCDSPPPSFRPMRLSSTCDRLFLAESAAMKPRLAHTAITASPPRGERVLGPYCGWQSFVSKACGFVSPLHHRISRPLAASSAIPGLSSPLSSFP